MILIRAADGYEVALIPTGSLASTYRPDQDPENAKLISAAPDMLEALRAMDRARATPMIDDDFPELLHRADSLMRIALAKADGRSG